MSPFNVFLCFVMCFGAYFCDDADEVNYEVTTQTILFQESAADFSINNPEDLANPTDYVRSGSTDSSSSNDSQSSGKSSPSADSSRYLESISLQDPSQMEAASPTSRRQRNLHGILGFLTGFRLAQGMGPTSYSADVRDNLDLNMFSRLFNAALFLSYIQNTNTLPLESVPTSYHPLLAYSQLSQNIFPTDLQLPVLYPPIASRQDINDPARQENNNNQPEVIAHNETNEQNQQDKNTTKIFALENAIKKVSTAKTKTEADKVKYSVENKTQADKITIMADNSNTSPKHNMTIVTAVPAKDFNLTNAKPMIKSIAPKFEDLKNATLKYETDEQLDRESSSSHAVPAWQTEGAKPNNMSTVANANKNSTEKPAEANATMVQTEMAHNVISTDHSFFPYPYPYYHDYENSTVYERITITESPMSQDHFLKEHEYYENPSTYDNYLPHQDSEQSPHPFVKGDNFEYPELQREHFHPMSIPYYNSPNSYASYSYQHDQIDNNNEVQNNGFVPIGTLKHF